MSQYRYSVQGFPVMIFGYLRCIHLCNLTVLTSTCTPKSTIISIFSSIRTRVSYFFSAALPCATNGDHAIIKSKQFVIISDILHTKSSGMYAIHPILCA